MTDPRQIIAHFGPATLPGRILTLEGGGGYMRVRLEAGPHSWPEVGHQGELQMHDGARFAVVVTDGQGDESRGTPREGHAEFRMKLLDLGG